MNYAKISRLSAPLCTRLPRKETGAARLRRSDLVIRVSSPSSSSKLPAALRALRHRNFQLFFGGQLISLIGTLMQVIAQSWLVYRLTGSSLLLGAVGFAAQIPVFLMAPLGGTTADRHGRKHVVIATQTSSMVLAFILAALTLTGKVQIWQVFLLAALLGVVNAFDLPARQAMLIDMVGKGDLMNAIALNSSMFNGSRIVGPAIAGVLVASIGEGWCFFANGASYIAVIISLLLMRVNTRRTLAAGSAAQQVIEGFRFVRRTAPIRASFAVTPWTSELGCDVLHSADACVRRPPPPSRGAGFRCLDGLGWRRCAAGRIDSGLAIWSGRTGPLDCTLLRRIWVVSSDVFLLSAFLALDGTPVPGGVLA